MSPSNTSLACASGAFVSISRVEVGLARQIYFDVAWKSNEAAHSKVEYYQLLSCGRSPRRRSETLVIWL